MALRRRWRRGGPRRPGPAYGAATSPGSSTVWSAHADKLLHHAPQRAADAVTDKAIGSTRQHAVRGRGRCRQLLLAAWRAAVPVMVVPAQAGPRHLRPKALAAGHQR